MINWNLWLVTEPLTCVLQKYLAAHTHCVFWNDTESERKWKERDPTQPLLFTEVPSLYAHLHATKSQICMRLNTNKGAGCQERGGAGRGGSRIPLLSAPQSCKQNLLPLLRTLSRAPSALIYVAPTAYGELKIVKKFKLRPLCACLSV